MGRHWRLGPLPAKHRPRRGARGAGRLRPTEEGPGWGRSGGLAMGPACSSARQEAIALYAGLAVQQPMHFGIDNAAVVQRASHLLKGRRAKTKPWGLQDDGDVWSQIARIITGLRTKHYRISKLKGHATEQHVAQGLITNSQQEGKHEADGVVRAAREDMRPHHRTVMQLPQNR